MMKRIFAMAIGLAVMTTACSKEEDNTTNNNNNNNGGNAVTLQEALPGDWSVTKVEQKNGVTDFGGTQITFTGNASDLAANMNFNSNGSFTMSGSYTMTLTMNFMGQTIPQTQPVDATSGGTWSVTADGDLKLEAPGEDPAVYEVISRTSTKVELMASIEVEQDFQGQKLTSTLDSYITIEK